MTILFTGGRNYNDRVTFEEVWYSLSDRQTVLVGDASGLDALVRQYAGYLDIPHKVFKADWDKHGRAAGPIRNAEMIKENPNLVIAFPGGKGTDNCVKQAKEAGIVVLRVDENE